MDDPLKDAQASLVKLFRDVYWKAGLPFVYADELRVKALVGNLVKSIAAHVVASSPPAAEAQPGGDPFGPKLVPGVKPAAAPPAPAEKTGFFGGLVKSKVVLDPHRKDKK